MFVNTCTVGPYAEIVAFRERERRRHADWPRWLRWCVDTERVTVRRFDWVPTADRFVLDAAETRVFQRSATGRIHVTAHRPHPTHEKTQSAELP